MITMGVMYVRRVCEKPSFGGYQHPISIHELINAARRTLPACSHRLRTASRANRSNRPEVICHLMNDDELCTRLMLYPDLLSEKSLHERKARLCMYTKSEGPWNFRSPSNIYIIIHQLTRRVLQMLYHVERNLNTAE